MMKRFTVVAAWTLAAFAPCGSAAQDAPPARHWRIVLEADGNGYKAVSKRRVDRPAPRRYRQPLGEGQLFIETTDSAGKALEAQSLPDPAEVFYDALEQPGHERREGPKALTGGRLRLPNARIVVRLAADPRAQFLKVYGQRGEPAAAQGKPGASMAPRASGASSPSTAGADGLDLELKASIDLGSVAEGEAR
ncbi:MAG: hypothetical protein HY554_11080 [Elusimicrobia bacterium]|nr:hypothetical protein [Elusimicrobiota bacterium]